MKNIVLLVSVILTMVLVVAIGCSDDKSSPEDTVEAFLVATITSGDVEQANSYLTQRMIDDMDGSHSFEEVVEMWASKDAIVTNIETTLVSQTKDEAVVKVSYDILTEYEGETVEQNTGGSFAIVKDGDTWLVDEDLGF